LKTTDKRICSRDLNALARRKRQEGREKKNRWEEREERRGVRRKGRQREREIILFL
jgi:hypothetical protein